MKKLSFCLSSAILLNFFAINCMFAHEDFFSASNFKKAQSTTETAVLQKDAESQQKELEKRQKNELKKQKKLQKKFAKEKKQKDVSPEDLKGYYGTLPNISDDFKYKEQKATSAKNTSKIPDSEDFTDSNLKNAPTEDALFLDMIVKKEKSSNYVNDIQKTKFALQNLKKCIEENGNIQRFNGCVNMIDLYTKNLKSKYENKSESLKESYKDILSTNYYSKVLGNLLFNANYYSQYVPVNTGEYSKQNIENEKQKLLNRINKTLFLINNES